MEQKRTQYEIYWEILTFCKEPRSFTSIINRCNLNSKIGQIHVNFLKERGLLTTLENEGKIHMQSTERANQYIELFSEIYQELFDNSPEFKL